MSENSTVNVTNCTKQVSLRPSMVADNMALLAFAARCLAATVVDRYLLPSRPRAANPPQQCAAAKWLDSPKGTQQQICRTLLQRSNNGTDREMDRHHSITQTLPHTMRSVSIVKEVRKMSRIHDNVRIGRNGQQWTATYTPHVAIFQRNQVELVRP